MPRSIYELYDSNGKKLYENDKQFILLHNQPGKKNQIIVKLKRKLCFLFGAKWNYYKAKIESAYV